MGNSVAVADLFPPWSWDPPPGKNSDYVDMQADLRMELAIAHDRPDVIDDLIRSKPRRHVLGKYSENLITKAVQCNSLNVLYSQLIHIDLIGQNVASMTAAILERPDIIAEISNRLTDKSYSPVYKICAGYYLEREAFDELAALDARCKLSGNPTAAYSHLVYAASHGVGPAVKHFLRSEINPDNIFHCIKYLKELCTVVCKYDDRKRQALDDRVRLILDCLPENAVIPTCEDNLVLNYALRFGRLTIVKELADRGFPFHPIEYDLWHMFEDCISSGDLATMTIVEEKLNGSVAPTLTAFAVNMQMVIGSGHSAATKISMVEVLFRVYRHFYKGQIWPRGVADLALLYLRIHPDAEFEAWLLSPGRLIPAAENAIA